MPTPGLLPPEERRMEVKKYSFKHKDAKDPIVFWTDGIDAWGENKKKVKLTYDFVIGYNQNTIDSNKWLLPDWFSLEQDERLKEDKLGMALLKGFATY